MAATNWETAWAVEKSETSAATGRMVSYLAADGREGVVSPQDCVLTPMSPATLRGALSPGAVTVKVRSSGATYQSYLARLPITDYVDFTAAPSASRSDLVVAIIKNPYTDPGKYAEAADPYAEHYAYTEVWKNVGAGVTKANQVDPTLSATALWRVDLPKGASSVTASMFKDLRAPVNTPPFDPGATFMDVKMLTSSITLPQAGGVGRADKRYWPDKAFWDIPVPSWATYMECWVEFNSRTQTGNTWGTLWLDWNGRLGPFNCDFDINMPPDWWTSCNQPTFTGAVRNPMMAGGQWSIPPEERGTYRRLCVRADVYGRQDLNSNGLTTVYDGSPGHCLAVFKQIPSSS